MGKVDPRKSSRMRSYYSLSFCHHHPFTSFQKSLGRPCKVEKTVGKVDIPQNIIKNATRFSLSFCHHHAFTLLKIRQVVSRTRSDTTWCTRLVGERGRNISWVVQERKKKKSNERDHQCAHIALSMCTHRTIHC